MKIKEKTVQKGTTKSSYQIIKKLKNINNNQTKYKNLQE